jgi:hypothetical protein
MIYDNLTDKELIREADGHSGLIKALSERLEMRLNPPSVFEDQAAVMKLMGLHPHGGGAPQEELFLRAIQTMMDTLNSSLTIGPEVDEICALLDFISVLIGYGLTRGWPLAAGWQEVMRANFAKDDPNLAALLGVNSNQMQLI